MFIISSCENENPTYQGEMVDVSFSVKFVESGSMTRSASELYTQFYNEYIKTKYLLPTNYTLTIYSLEGAEISTLHGTWDLTMIRRPLGKYRISGESTNDSDNDIQLIFDEEIEITSSGTIELTAQYNCYLIMCPKNGSEEEYRIYRNPNNSSTRMYSTSSIHYIFAKEGTNFSYITYKEYYSGDYQTLNIEELSSTFKNGYYYYFDQMSGTFDIPMMENGGIY